MKRDIIIAGVIVLVLVAAIVGLKVWAHYDPVQEGAAPAVETPSVRCEAALGLRETTVEAGIRNTYLAPGVPPAGKLPQQEYDRLLRQAEQEIRLFC
jgi:hypothetical protein